MNTGGGDHPSPPLPAGEYLLQLLRRGPLTPQHPLPHQHHHDPAFASLGPPIQSNGHAHPPFAPHAYIHHRYPPPNPINSVTTYQNNIVSVPDTDTDTRSSRISGENYPLNVSGNNYRNSPDSSRIGGGYNRALNGNEADYRNSQNLSRVGEGYNRVSNGSRFNYQNSIRMDGGYNNMALNGYEMDRQNIPNLIRTGEGYNRALSGNETNYRNSPSMSRVGEGYNRALNGYQLENQNFRNLSRTGEGYNRALNGIEGDCRNSPNLSRFGEGNNRALNRYQNSPNPSRIREQNSFQKNPSYGKNQGTGSRTVTFKQEVKPSTAGSVKKKINRNSVKKFDKEKGNSNGSKERSVKHKNERKEDGVIDDRGLSTQLDSPGPPAGSTLPSVSGVEVEESLSELQCEMDENKEKQIKVGNEGLIENDSDDGYEQRLGLLEENDGSTDKNRGKKRDKGCRSDTRGQKVLSQGMRKSYRQIECRGDIDMLNAPLLGIYDSLIPLEEEKIKQKQLLTWLENIVTKEWPEARLYVYGSCANSFGLRNSDIDICLAMKDDDVNKSEVLLKLADILKAEKLENVQALTHARVPIVKLMDPSTSISCDICINNVLAVVNSKLLRDYATIDDRLRQLAFIVKHWAKSRGVNETYHGTLSSYAYVLMCIHFLQQRRPAILPCLQGMDTTYSVVADNVECAFFDQVETLSGFGSPNRESIGQLVWGFFRYWAFCHDYAQNVISVRVGSMISKRAKDWTRRVGRDRHLLCIEDPFETSHDLGRVVDKRSIKVIKEEFERAGEILQFDPNPCVTLFEPYVPC